MRTRCRDGRFGRGFTLLEALLLLSIFSVAALGVSVGLQTAVDTSVTADRTLAVTTELTSEADNWRGVAFGGAPWPASLPYSLTDTVTLSLGGVNRTFSRVTTIANWDPNNIGSNASPQSNFVQIQITIDGRTLTFYLCNPL